MGSAKGQRRTPLCYRGPTFERGYSNPGREIQLHRKVRCHNPLTSKRLLNILHSEKQLKSRLPKWGLDVKNLKGETMLEIARTKAKRKLEDKDSSFRFNKKPVNDANIDRYLRRHDIGEEMLLDMRSPIDGNLSRALKLSSLS